MLAFRWRWSVAKNSAGFALARYKIRWRWSFITRYPLALAQTLTSGPAEPPNSVWDRSKSGPVKTGPTGPVAPALINFEYHILFIYIHKSSEIHLQYCTIN